MTSLLDSLPNIINGAFKGLFYPAVMTVYVPVESPDPADPLPPVPVSYPCRAYVENYSAYYRANSLIDAKDRKVIVLAKSMSIEPVIGATLAVQGVPFTIIAYDDGGSARSVWEIQGRGSY